MQDNSQEFEQLRQLLALKRHETPPPGYFSTFSARVVQQLERESARPESTIRRLLQALQLRPGISVAFGIAALLILVAGTTLFEGNPAGSTAQMPPVDGHFVASPEPNLPSANSAGALFITNLGLALEAAPAAHVSTNRSLFETPFYDRIDPNLNLRVEPARFDR